jgi:cytidylate kinase
MIITIDGPAGTGKTTVAKKVAGALGFRYFDTGAMYRAVTYLILNDKIDLSDKPRIVNLLEKFHFDIREVKGEKKYFVDNSDVTDEIRSSSVTSHVSAVAALSEVRHKLVEIQRQFGKNKNAVFEGRDLGSVVFPEAELKIYLTARPAVRAERRYLEVKDTAKVAGLEEVMQDIMGRDLFDSTRELSPLKQTEDAHLIDTSDLTLEEVIQQVIALVPKKNRAKGGS